ncbi:hypothetical protein HJG60_010592 [Phyllostomus discolor]|uniref:Uncharacterized protein n=1 Tax=Phyllostomus discolor TaxID=89673 RepID=A0A834ARL7_9CHIR|nr:hypothetical protein HJG60_010592 [Phyllostomus discolor]
MTGQLAESPNARHLRAQQSAVLSGPGLLMTDSNVVLAGPAWGQGHFQELSTRSVEPEKSEFTTPLDPADLSGRIYFYREEKGREGETMCDASCVPPMGIWHPTQAFALTGNPLRPYGLQAPTQTCL